MCGPPPMVDAAIPVLTALGVPEQNIFYDKFTTTGEQGEDCMTTTERPERSVPKPQFTDAEAGAREFPDSSAAARRYNYFKPAKRKQTHYEDVTVDVQPDPRHYLSQGWIYGFADGSRGYPLDLDEAQGVGRRQARARERPRHRQPARRRLARPRLARVPRPQRGVGDHHLPVQRERCPAGQPEHRERPPGQGVRAVDRRTGCTSSSATSARGCTSSTSSGSTCSPRATARARRTCTTRPWSINSEHKIRFAQDLALYNLTLSEEIEGFDGTAHLDAWNNDEAWQGARKVTEALTAVDDDWGESIFATNVVFEPLIGELFRSNLVQQIAAAERRLRHPDGRRRGRVRLLPA